jgi:hypothetical protein
MATFDAYDIECLMHVYNKFGRQPNTQPITDATQLLNMNIITCIYNEQKQNQPCTISNEVADFLGQPRDTIITVPEICDLFMEYCSANELKTINQVFAPITVNEAIVNLLNLDDWRIGVSTTIHTIIQHLIISHHIRIVMPLDNYVLK